MTVEKPKPKQLLRPITIGAGSAMNQSQFLAITCNSLEAREESRVRGAIGFGFVSYWLRNWRDSFKPITKRSNRNHVITFNSHLKTALIACTNNPADTISHLLTSYIQGLQEQLSYFPFSVPNSFTTWRVLNFHFNSLHYNKYWATLVLKSRGVTIIMITFRCHHSLW